MPRFCELITGSSGDSPHGFGRNGLSSNGSVGTDDGTAASRGHKVGRNRGVKGVKKILAVAAALRVSRTMEPRIGGKRKGESFLVLGKRKTYEGEMEQVDNHTDINTKYFSDALSRSSSSSSSTSYSSSSVKGYADFEKQNLLKCFSQFVAMENLKNKRQFDT